MMTKLKRFLSTMGLLLLLAGSTGPAQAQDPEEGWQVYTNANYVNDLALEGGGALGGGYTWVAARGGVVCYSASQQVKFTILDGLVDNYVLAIAEASGGRWWFGTSGGVSVLDDGGTPFDKGDDTWTTFTTTDGLAGYNVYAIAEGGWGWLWFGTSGGVSVLDDGGTPFDKGDDTWTTFTTADGLAYNFVKSIAEDGGGRLWFGTWHGVSVLDDGGTPFDKGDDTWITFTNHDGLAENYVEAIAEDGGGRWWFGTNGGVSVLDNGGTPFDKGDDIWNTFTNLDGLANDEVNAVAEDSRGRLWFGTEGGTSMLDDGDTPFDKGDDTWTTFTTADGLAVNYVQAIAEDSGGRWWFGTYDRGVSVVYDGGTPLDKGDDTWTTFTESDGLAHSTVHAIAEDGGGRQWFGTQDGVSVLDDGGTPFDKGDDTWTTFTFIDGLAGRSSLAFAEDRGGRWWFGTANGVSVLDNGGTPFNKGDDTWATFTTADGLADNFVESVAEDGGGRLWFGTWFGGVSVLDDSDTPFDKRDDTWTTFTTADGLADNFVKSIAEDGGGRLWFGTGGGASVLDDGGMPFDKADDTWTTFTTADGLADNDVQAIAEDGGGQLWFGTWGGGVSALDDGGTPFDKGDDTWTTFTTADGLVSNYVRAIATDGGGRLWFGTHPGVSALDNGGTPFDKGNDIWTTFTTVDGLVDNSVHDIAKDGEGRMWFGTESGLGGLVDAVAPSSSASSPAYANVPPVLVLWSASDGASGVFGATLWVRYDSGGTWTETGLSQRGQSAGTFYYTPTQGDGSYYFAAVAEDWMGNAEATPAGSGDDSTVYDTIAPTASASSPATTAEHAFTVSWSGDDATSGVATYDVQYRVGSSGTWQDWQAATTQTSATFGPSDPVAVQEGQTYFFRARARDRAGNVGAYAPEGNCSTYVGYYPGDAYEPDDACAQARPVLTDGTVQVHTFHQQADADWVTFDAISGTTYLIEAQVPADSPADVALALYDGCDGPPQDGQDHAFSPGVRLEFQAPADGPLYLKLLNHDPAVYGPDVAYHLSARALDDAPTPGAVVLVAGKLRDSDRLQPNIHYVTNAVYRLFLAHGYDGDRIHYLATDVTLDPDNDGTPDVDGLPTPENLQQAITAWAAGKVGPERAFTLYLMDHGDYDRFYLNGSTQTVSPDDLNGWLATLEAAAPGVRVNVIVEACHSGSFIDSASSTHLIQTVSGPGRVVITSTGAWNPAYASQDGAAFSDPFVQALGSGMSLYNSFQEARWAVQAAHPAQTPWLDDDGDGRHDAGEDGREAAQRGFAYPGMLGEGWPPYVVWAEIKEVQGGQGVIEAEVRDDAAVSKVWAVVYPPSYQPPAPGETEELVLESLETETLSDKDGDGVYRGVHDGFDEAGAYRVVVYAVDGGGLVGRPKGAEVHRLYLPLVLR